MKSNAFYFKALLGVVAFTALMSILFGRPHSDGNDFWQPSSFNPGQRGHKALYVALQELHWPVARWQGSYRELTGRNQVMLMARNTLSTRYNLEPVEIDQLLRWVARGNSLILLGDFASSKDAQPLLQQLGFPATPPASAGERLFEQGSQLLSEERKRIALGALLPLPSDPSALWLGSIDMEQCTPLPPSPSGARDILEGLGDNEGFHYGVQIPHGRGVVTLIASSSLLDNTFLPLDNNLAFVLCLLQPAGTAPARVWFEEAHHGYRTTFALTDLFHYPGIRLAAGQIAIGLLVFLSGQLFRFGPVRPLHRQKARSTLEFVNSLANLYRRANLRDETVEALFHETHQAILKKFNLPPRTGHDVIARRLAEAFPHLPKWKKLAQRFDSDDYVQGLPPTGWLKVSRELILIKNAML